MSYSDNLLHGGSALTRFSHPSRFRTALQLISHNIYECALDFGCGDGVLLKGAYDQGLIKSAYGIDVDEEMLAQCEVLLGDARHIRFCRPDDLLWVVPEHACDLAICTEVLEHVDDPGRFIKMILSRCRKGARLIVSVPIELGPPLLAKQIGRYLANRSKQRCGYERYRLNALIKAGLLFDVTSFPSSHSSGASHRGHKGFDYRHIHRLFSRHVDIEKQLFSPISPFLLSDIVETA